MKSAIKIIGTILIIAVLIPIVFLICLVLWGVWNDEWTGYNASLYVGDGYCNIAVLPILGDIHTFGASFDEAGTEMLSTNLADATAFLRQAETEPGILGVLAQVDSLGGSAAAADLITAELKKSQLPNAAYIVESGTSAGYLIASGADTVMASPFADVGSIGVTMSYLDYSKQNADLGVEYVSLSSGKYKDYLNPDKPLTAEERTLLERDLAIWHDEFVKQVAENRDLSVEEVAKLADGSSMPAALALEAKLIDGVGDKELVRAWFADQLDLTPEEVVFCE